MDTISYYLRRERQPNTNTRSAVTFVAEKPSPPSLPVSPISLHLLKIYNRPSLPSPVSVSSSKASLSPPSPSPFPSHPPSLSLLLLSQYMCEESISPFPCVRVKYSVQIFLWNSLWVYHVSYPLDAFQFLKGLEKNPPSRGLSTPAGSYHHYTVSQKLNLIQLQYLHII